MNEDQEDQPDKDYHRELMSNFPITASLIGGASMAALGFMVERFILGLDSDFYLYFGIAMSALAFVDRDEIAENKVGSPKEIIKEEFEPVLKRFADFKNALSENRSKSKIISPNSNTGSKQSNNPKF